MKTDEEEKKLARKEYLRQWYLKNRVARLAYMKDRYAMVADQQSAKRKQARKDATVRETDLQRQKEWRDKNKEVQSEKQRQWRIANAERKYFNDKNYRESNKSRVLEVKKQWENANKERVLSIKKKYRDSWPEKCKIHAHNRRDRIGSDRLTSGLLKKLLSSQKCLCANCRCDLYQSGYHLDHIMPIALGGRNVDENIQLLCPKCNMSKGAKHPIDWAKSQGRLL